MQTLENVRRKDLLESPEGLVGYHLGRAIQALAIRDFRELEHHAERAMQIAFGLELEPPNVAVDVHSGEAAVATS